MAVTLAALVARFGGELVGDGAQTVNQVAPLDRATPDQIGFVSQSKYLAQLASTRAGAVILPAGARDATDLPRILTLDPYLYFARVSAWLNPPPRPPAGIHPAATVAADAEIAADASIAAGAVIGHGACIGARTVVGPNCVVGDHARIGADCLLHANVTLYYRCEVGDRAILHSGCVIGADGFGFAPNEGCWEKIP
ncbi:MAG: LpxD N-terminal domain-containing protein, partial [Thiobacillus sp.]|nr:LpxD N-terminal domain-containing protein [Thiobacillus sp.]